MNGSEEGGKEPGKEERSREMRNWSESGSSKNYENDREEVRG